MATIFAITTTKIAHPKGEREFNEIFQREMPKRVVAYQVKMLFAATCDSYYDELYHYAVFETREQADHLMARIDAASGKINLEHWITGGCIAASSLKGGATETVFIPAVKF